MELLIYLFGNWICIGAACIVLWHYLKNGFTTSNPEFAKKRRSTGEHPSAFDFYSHDSDKDLLISKDLMTMLFISSLFRIYWSLSPEPVYSHEPLFIQYLAILDLAFTALIWGACVIVSNEVFWHSVGEIREKGVGEVVSRISRGGGQSSGVEMPEMTSAATYARRAGGSDLDADVAHAHMQLVTWPKVTGFVFVLSALMQMLLPTLSTPDAWPCVDFAVVFNLVLDGAAILPQVMLITKSTDKHGKHSKASNFLGLLCLGRVLRMIFWLIVKLSDPSHNEALWTFVIPDTLHTLIMADYLYLWLTKVKRDQIDPIMARGGLL